MNLMRKQLASSSMNLVIGSYTIEGRYDREMYDKNGQGHLCIWRGLAARLWSEISRCMASEIASSYVFFFM